MDPMNLWSLIFARWFCLSLDLKLQQRIVDKERGLW